LLKPIHFVFAARATLALGSLAVAILTLGPFQGAERAVGLSDKAAHAIAFGGLLAVSFLAFPRMRRNDLAIAALVLGAGVEVAQLFGGRSASVFDWLADAAGIAVIHGASMIETIRKMTREQGDLTFAQISARNRRRRRRAPVAPKRRETEAAVLLDDASSFAQRAARHFPVR
jgi:VanZ family protein